jgi:hypothetical protein
MVLSPTAFTSASQPTIIKLYKDGKGGNNTDKAKANKGKEKTKEKRKEDGGKRKRKKEKKKQEGGKRKRKREKRGTSPHGLTLNSNPTTRPPLPPPPSTTIGGKKLGILSALYKAPPSFSAISSPLFWTRRR